LKLSDFRLVKAASPRRKSAIYILQSAILLGSVCWAGTLAAQGDSSLTESKNENEALRRELSLARESVRTLTDSLAESNLQAEVFRRKYSDLELRMEALGL